MKGKFILAALLMMMAGMQSAMAQKMIVMTNDGNVISVKLSNLNCVLFEEANPDEHEWVDLGLPSGTLWATCNIGADNPEDYGGYFAWGETSTKSEYSWGTYKWMTEGKSNWEYINKYTRADGQTTGCWYSDETFVGDNETELELSDDAAFALWGSQWRMPNIDQYLELINTDYTTTEWTTQNGVIGRKITSRSNGNTLFLPASGVIWDNKGVTNAGKLGYYWSRSLSTINDRAGSLVVRSEYAFTNNSDRYEGRCVRPVRRGHDYVDLGLPSGTLWATCNVGADSPEEDGDYFAWGETEPKEVYSWETYKWCEGTEKTLTKYCNDSKYGYNGFTDGLRELEPEDDAATANWGSMWQMPSGEQVEELINEAYTTTEWTKQNGVLGRKFTSKSNGKSIFLPNSGCHQIWEGGPYFIKDGDFCILWTRTSLKSNSRDGDVFVAGGSELVSCRSYVRDWGLPVRPVRKK